MRATLLPPGLGIGLGFFDDAFELAAADDPRNQDPNDGMAGFAISWEGMGSFVRRRGIVSGLLVSPNSDLQLQLKRKRLAKRPNAGPPAGRKTECTALK